MPLSKLSNTHRHNSRNTDTMKHNVPSIVSLLCEDCKHLGFCKRALGNGRGGLAYVSREIGRLGPQDRSDPLTQGELSRWVPVRTTVKDATSDFGRRLQQAHDLFHQEEYEQASYMYLDMMLGRADCDEVRVGLAACFFFLGRFDEAVVIASELSNSLHMDFPSRFEWLCVAMTHRSAEGEDALSITDYSFLADPCKTGVATG